MYEVVSKHQLPSVPLTDDRIALLSGTGPCICARKQFPAVFAMMTKGPAAEILSPDREATTSGPTLEFAVHFRAGDHGRKRLRKGAEPSATVVDPGHIPRISKLMALALRFERMVHLRAVSDYAELARLGGVTRARMSQIVALLNLAPDIQEELLTLPRTTGGRDPITERQLRTVVVEVDWERQRELMR